MKNIILLLTLLVTMNIVKAEDTLALTELGQKLEMQCKDGAASSCVEYCNLSWNNDWDDSDTCNTVIGSKYFNNAQ